VVANQPDEADHVIIEKDFFGVLMRAWKKDEMRITKPVRINVAYSVQCPDCGFVQTGFETQDEAAAWECDQCQPMLPLDEQ